MSLRRILIADHVSKVLGGAEINLVELLNHPNVSSAWDVTVACAPQSPLDRALADSGIRRVPYGFAPALNELRVIGRGLAPLAKIRGFLELRKATRHLDQLLRQVRPDAVLTPTNKDHFAAGAAARPLKIPSLWWVNDLLIPEFFSWPIRRLFSYKAQKLATHLLPVSAAGADALVAEGLPLARITPVLNGIPLDRYARSKNSDLRQNLQIPADHPLFGVIGRITPWKGQDLFIRIAQAWCASRQKGHFVIIGKAFNEDAPFEKALRQQITEAGLSKRVHFTSFQSDSVNALSGLDALLHTSTRPEPFGRVIIEAMATETPVIAARAGGVPSIITADHDGLLATLGDVNDYLRLLMALHDNPLRAASLRLAGLETVRSRFSIDRVFTDFESILAKLPPVPI